MKKVLAAILFLVVLPNAADAQLTKGNWMVGGTGSFSTASYSIITQQVKSNNLSLSPSVGFFIADRLPVGLRFFLSNYHATYADPVGGSTGLSNNFSLSTGPFVRYYFFKNLKRPVNLLIETNYNFGYSSVLYTDKAALNRFSFNAGPVFYFNNNIGIEFLLGYYHLSQYGENTNGFQACLGFQVHLEKEKNKQ